jgi:hypothetical protein
MFDSLRIEGRVIRVEDRKVDVGRQGCEGTLENKEGEI